MTYLENQKIMALRVTQHHRSSLYMKPKFCKPHLIDYWENLIQFQIYNKVLYKKSKLWCRTKTYFKRGLKKQMSLTFVPSLACLHYTPLYPSVRSFLSPQNCRTAWYSIVQEHLLRCNFFYISIDLNYLCYDHA